MNEDRSISRAGYLRENYHYFHLRDTAGQELDFHFHEFDKVVLLLTGRVDYIVEGHSYALKPWDVLLVKHHTIHKAEIDQSVPYERIIIYLDGKYFGRSMPEARLMDSFDQADRTGEHLLTPSVSQRQEIQRVLSAYEDSARDEGIGAPALRETFIIQLLIHISRMTASAAPSRESQYDPKIQQVLSYINEHLHEELTVDQLAERAYLSKYHSCACSRPRPAAPSTPMCVRSGCCTPPVSSGRASLWARPPPTAALGTIPPSTGPSGRASASAPAA